MNIAEKIRDYFLWKNFKNSWEFKGASFIVRACFALAFIGYVIVAAPQAWTWAKMTLIRSLEFSRLDGVLRNGVATGDMDGAMAWVELRPLSENAALRKALEPYYSDVPTRLFFLLRSRYKRENDKDEAAFWEMVARYRLRYDVLRCGAPDSINTMNGLLSLMLRGEEEKTPKMTKDLIRRTLDFDAAHPARNDPSGVCKQVDRITRSNGGVVPQENWAGIRHTLRVITEIALKTDFNETAPQEKK